ncbi:hypothetical protein, partial [Streptomyces lonarensis]
MTGDQLVDTLMKDFIRPQVMISDTVPITHDNIQYPPTTNTTTSTTALAAPGPHNNDTFKDLLADAAGPDIVDHPQFDQMVETLERLRPAFEPHGYNLPAITREIINVEADHPIGQTEVAYALMWAAQANTYGKAGSVAEIATHALAQEALAQEHIVTHVPALADWAQSPAAQLAYNQMADWGNLWRDALFGGYPGGRALIARMSHDNLWDMRLEIGPQEGWHQDLRARVEQALSNRVLHHYTTADRVETMLAPGQSHEIKSKYQLVHNAPESSNPAENNTPEFDEIEFANDSFVFFFLADADAPFRGSRFGEGGAGPARIAVSQQPLSDEGWIMLTDFADREWPTLRADADGNLLSYRRDALPETASPEARMWAAQQEIIDIWNDGLGALYRTAYELSSDLSDNFATDADHVSPEATAKIVKLAEVNREIREKLLSYDDGRGRLDRIAHDLSTDLSDAFADDSGYLSPEIVGKIVEFAAINREIREQLRATGEWDTLQGLASEREANRDLGLRFDRQVRRYWPQMIYSAASNWSYPMRGGTTRH